MTKEVLITISGLQIMDEEGGEPVEVITAGEYYYRNGKHYILYDEVMEGFEGVTKNRIRITQDCLDVSKKGVSNVHMIFEKNRKNLTSYQTPFGNLMIGIDARNLQISEEENMIDIKVDYDLEINYEPLAECSLTMNIRSKEAEGFSLSS